MRFHACMLVVTVALCFPAWSQQAPATLQGGFNASAGPVSYRGKWSGAYSPGTPNTVSGQWILLNEHNDIVLQGTWSARKSGAGWKGTWRARVERGRAYAGTWTATEPGLGSKTFADMLHAATRGVISGTWASGGFGGDFTLRPAP